MDRDPDCDEVRAALSARLDEEDPGVPPDALDRHLARCAACERFDAAIRAQGGEHRPVVEVAPDAALPGRVARAAAEVDRAGVWWVLRALLLLVAGCYLLVEIPELLLSEDVHHAHLAHHMGIFEAAYAVALVLVAVRPARARALVPSTVVLAAGMVLFAVIDVRQGEAFPLSEMSHLLELAGMVLVWLLATRRGWPGRSRAGRGDEDGTGGASGGLPSPTVDETRHLRVAPSAPGTDARRRAG